MATDNVVLRRKKRKIKDIEDDDDNKYNDDNTNNAQSPKRKKRRLNHSNNDRNNEFHNIQNYDLPKLKQLNRFILNGSTNNMKKFINIKGRKSSKNKTKQRRKQIDKKDEEIKRFTPFLSIMPQIRSMANNVNLAYNNNNNIITDLNKKRLQIQDKLIKESKIELVEQMMNESDDIKEEEYKYDIFVLIDFDNTIFPTVAYDEYTKKKDKTLKPEIGGVMTAFKLLIIGVYTKKENKMYQIVEKKMGIRDVKRKTQIFRGSVVCKEIFDESGTM